MRPPTIPTVPRTVLVVDDDAQMRALLRDVLRHDGFRVIEGGSGPEALAELERARPDVVILDKEIPEPGGLDVLSWARRRFPELPVALVTAFGGPAVAEEALRRGASLYLEKPFRLGRILEFIRSVAVSPSVGGCR